MTQQFGGGGGTSCSSASSVCTFSLVQFCIIAHHRASTCRHADRNLFYNQLTCQLWRVSTFSFHKQFLYTCHNSPVGRSVGVGRCGSTAELDKDVSKVFSVVVTLHLFNLCYQKRVIVEVLLLYSIRVDPVSEESFQKFPALKTNIWSQDKVKTSRLKQLFKN